MVFMLEEYPQVRSSAAEVLDHPWVSVSNNQLFLYFAYSIIVFHDISRATVIDAPVTCCSDHTRWHTLWQF